MGSNQQFSLRWNNYINHITGAFDSLRSDEDLVDVTLSCEGKRIRAHKMLLSACSTYFRDLFKENPCPHPVIIFRNVKFEDLVALIDFMYQGEVNVVQDQLASFLTTAELLAVQGLSEGGYKDSNSREDDLANSPALPPEPEIQMTSSGHVHNQPESSSSTSGASPISFVTTDPETESPCVKRRKKGSSAVMKSNSGTDVASKCSERENESDRNFSNQSNGDSSTAHSEIIPVISNLKVEVPEYMEHDLSSTNYGETNRSVGNVTSGQEIKTERISLPHSVPKRDSADDRNVDPPDMFCHNSRESSLPSVPESLSASDIGQVLSKPGTSTERQAQDSLQGDPGLTAGNLWFTMPPTSEFLSSHHEKKFDYKDAQFLCRICGKGFRSQNSCYDHMAIHRGTSKCTICDCVLSRKANMKRHMRFVHGVID